VGVNGYGAGRGVSQHPLFFLDVLNLFS